MSAARHRNAAEIWYEGANGWFAALKPGLCTEPGLHSAHSDETLPREAGLRDLLRKLDAVRLCRCADCVGFDPGDPGEDPYYLEEGEPF